MDARSNNWLIVLMRFIDIYYPIAKPINYVEISKCNECSFFEMCYIILLKNIELKASVR